MGFWFYKNILDEIESEEDEYPTPTTNPNWNVIAWFLISTPRNSTDVPFVSSNSPAFQPFSLPYPQPLKKGVLKGIGFTPMWSATDLQNLSSVTEENNFSVQLHLWSWLKHAKWYKSVFHHQQLPFERVGTVILLQKCGWPITFMY